MTDPAAEPAWAENRCDGCDRHIHPNAGALCVRCALSFDPFIDPSVTVETPDSVFDAAPADDTYRRFNRAWRGEAS